MSIAALETAWREACRDFEREQVAAIQALQQDRKLFGLTDVSES